MYTGLGAENEVPMGNRRDLGGVHVILDYIRDVPPNFNFCQVFIYYFKKFFIKNNFVK